MLALVRAETDVRALRELGVPFHVCDLSVPASYAALVREDDVLLEMANLRQARKLLPHLASLGVRRAFCVTTTAVFSRHHSFSQEYRVIEEEMRASPLDVTILRPSMIYGNERDKNMHKLLRFIAKWKVYPLFGAQALMQPVQVEDLAAGIARAVLRDARGEYNLAGPRPLPYATLVRHAFGALGLPPRLVALPAAPVAAAAGVLEKLPGFPLKREQVVRLQEDKAFDIGVAHEVLGYAPRSFKRGIEEEVWRLRMVGLL